MWTAQLHLNFLMVNGYSPKLPCNAFCPIHINLIYINLNFVVELTHEFLQILEKTPSRLKRIRNWRVSSYNKSFGVFSFVKFCLITHSCYISRLHKLLRSPNQMVRPQIAAL